jgi:co-chaperonin GroES (HSP10)
MSSPKPACDLIPMEFNVVIEMDTPQERIGSILLPPSVLDAEKTKADEGILIAVSPLAFNFDEWPEGSRKPEVGDRVLIGRYSGISREKDKTVWRIVKDKDIIAIVEQRTTQDEIVDLLQAAAVA